MDRATCKRIFPLALLAFAAAVVVAIASIPSRAAESASKVRNVLLLVGDDTGLELGCYGGKARTPNLDALAQRGTLFKNGFATVSSCSPSRAVMYTGLYTHTNGQYGLAHGEHNVNTRPNVKSLPARLHPLGYRSGIIGKLHVIPPAVYPFDVEVPIPQAQPRNVPVLAGHVEKFLAADKDKPFLLVVGFTDTHRAGRDFGNEDPGADLASEHYKPEDVVVPPFLPDSPAVRRDLADYCQSVTRLDRGVGAVLQKLRDAGHADDTLVIFVSDNGIPFPGAKTTLYDAGVHLPLILSSPNQSQHGKPSDAMVSWVDLAPTILDVAGKEPKDLPGRSLLPLLDTDSTPPGWDVVYGSHVQHEVTMYYPMRSIRTRTHKYILNLASALEFPTAQDLFGSKTWQSILKPNEKSFGGRDMNAYLHRPREELYDLQRDPNEFHNVAGDAAYAQVLDDLRALLKTWQTQTKDPWLVKYSHE